MSPYLLKALPTFWVLLPLLNSSSTVPPGLIEAIVNYASFWTCVSLAFVWVLRHPDPNRIRTPTRLGDTRADGIAAPQFGSLSPTINMRGLFAARLRCRLPCWWTQPRLHPRVGHPLLHWHKIPLIN